MVFSYNWLKDYVKNLPKPEKLAELLTLRSFEVADFKSVKSDYALDVDVLPNRAGDCFSHIGIAREIAAITNVVFPTPDVGKFSRHRESGEESGETKDFISVEVRSKSYCPRYTARAISGVKIGPSPKWLKDRLAVCGLNSINNVVDAANYVMLETGQPLHAFDLDKLEGGKLIVRFAKDGEKITTLDNQTFNLSPKILVISDAQKPVAIAGIKGGKTPEVDSTTKTVVLESANFNPAIIRRGSRELGLKTDASLRFEHGIDPNLTESAVNKAVFLAQKIAGGLPASGLVDFYPQKVYPRKIKLDLNYVESLLGVKIAKGEIANILRRLGFKIMPTSSSIRDKIGKNLKLKIFDVEVPTFRLDILLPEDLIEEIGRIFGYEKIAPAFPTVSLIAPKMNDDLLWENMVKDILKESGFVEVYNYSFQKEGGAFDVEVINPASQEYKYLRPSLIANLLRNIEKNINNFSQIKIFELGKIFSAQGGSAPGGKEKRMLTGLVAGQDFYQLKGIIDSLFGKLGIAKVWYDDYQASPEDSSKSLWHPKKSAEIKVGNTELGFLGELRKNPGLVAFDLDFEKLKTLATEEHEYRPISKYPAVIRDLAVLVPLLTRVEEVLNIIEVAGGPLAIDVDLFDIYEGEEITEGKKNLAFHIIYQAQDRTLTSIEVYKIHQKIINALEENPEWQVRR